MAVVVHAGSGSGPAVCRRLAADGFEVRALAGVSVNRRTVGEAVALASVDGIDLLVNNGPALGFEPAPVGPLQFSDALEAGLNGLFSACREAARIAIGRRECLTIVNIISALASVGLAGKAAEACVSAGVLAATKALAAEWGPSRVRVVAVMVGPTDEWLDGSGSLDSVPGVVPLGRTVSHEAVAAAVSVLVGPDLIGLTGQAVIVDGGWLAHGWRRD